jgi:hypothetical protein
MSNKRFAIFNTETGEIRKTGDETILSEIIDSKENIVPIEATTGQVSFVDTNDAISKGTVPETNVTTTPELTYTDRLPGVIEYDVPQRLLASHDVMGRLILGGQHVSGTTMSGTYTVLNDNTTSRYVWNFFPEFEQLKARRGDHFQILSSGSDLLDGIYKVRGFDDHQLIATKVSGSTGSSGLTGSFDVSLATGHNIIRLQAVDGVSFGLSADVEGNGIYQFGEQLEQSVYKVTNSGGVKHESSQKKFGSASAFFAGKGSGTTGPHLSINSSSGYTFDGTSKYLFKLSSFVKFSDAAPSSEQVICAKKNAGTGVGAYLLKYDNSPSSFVFTYSTNDSASSFNKTMTANLPISGVTLADWTHVQVEFGDLEGRLYLNGVLRATSAMGATEEIFQDSSVPFTIGAESDGTDPLKGYIDHVQMDFDTTTVVGSSAILDGGPGGATGTTLAIGATLTVPTFGSTANNFTKLIFPMNGADESTLFVESGFNIAEAESRVYDDDRRVLTFSRYGLTGSATGFNSTQGFLRGQDLAGGNTAGITGNSEATHPILGVELGITTGLTLSGYQDVLVEVENVRFIRETNFAGMSGSSGAPGDFVQTFAGFTGGSGGTSGTGDNAATGPFQQLTFLATDSNTNELIEANELVGLCAASSNDVFYLENASNQSFGIFGYELAAFLTDVITFRNSKRATHTEIVTDIEGASDFEDISTGGKAQNIPIIPPVEKTFTFGK